MILVNAYKQLFERFLGLYSDAVGLLQRYDSVVSTLKSWQSRLGFLPEESNKAVVLEIKPQDFGYSSWLDRTPDSGFIEKYILRSHLLNGGAAQGSDPAPFPDFLWNFTDDRTQERGLADWLYGGIPYGFPLGDIAVRGHREWYRRVSLTLDVLFEFVGVFRQIVWP